MLVCGGRDVLVCGGLAVEDGGEEDDEVGGMKIITGGCAIVGEDVGA